MARWSICILTVAEREPLFKRLMAVLEPQIGDRDIEILIANQEDWYIPRKRQWCLDHAQGLYLNFCDDDDLVADNYVDAIYPLLDGMVDYIGFQVQFYSDNKPWNPTYHSLRYDEWYSDANGYYRRVSHLNPIKADIARQGRFEGDYGEDIRWAHQVKPKTEHYIDQTMYYYLFSESTSLASRGRGYGGIIENQSTT